VSLVRGPSVRAVALYAIALTACAGVLVLGFARPTLGARWLADVAVLGAISLGAEFTRSRKPGWLGTLDASFVVALVALVLTGPYGAVAVRVGADLLARMLGRGSRRPVNVLFSVTSGVAECLAGALVLRAAPGGLTELSAAPALFTAGLAMVATSFVVGPALFSVLVEGDRPGRAFAPFTDALGVEVGLAAAGAGIALASGPLGVFALLAFAVAVEIPGLALGRLTCFDAVRAVDRGTARRSYAEALADVLALPRRDRRAMEAGLAILDGATPSRMAAPTVDVTEVLLRHDEWWDGSDGDVGAEWIPPAARVIAVADAWSAMTAAGTPGLDHDEALLGLSSGSGTRFDPEVVDAAARVVATESPYAQQPAFLPRLHTVPGPRVVRRGALPRLLETVAGE
jgi:hypothetical protein